MVYYKSKSESSIWNRSISKYTLYNLINKISNCETLLPKGRGEHTSWIGTRINMWVPKSKSCKLDLSTGEFINQQQQQDTSFIQRNLKGKLVTLGAKMQFIKVWGSICNFLKVSRSKNDFEKIMGLKYNFEKDLGSMWNFGKFLGSKWNFGKIMGSRYDFWDFWGLKHDFWELMVIKM